MDDNDDFVEGYTAGTSGYYYVYDENSLLYPYVEAYEEYLKSIGVSSASATLMSADQAETLGCSTGPDVCDSPSWVYLTSYWLGSREDYNRMFFVLSNNGYGQDSYSCDYSDDSTFGARPVITISTSELG